LSLAAACLCAKIPAVLPKGPGARLATGHGAVLQARAGKGRAGQHKGCSQKKNKEFGRPINHTIIVGISPASVKQKQKNARSCECLFGLLWQKAKGLIFLMPENWPLRNFSALL
jgi:hypothetical protein